ncbi:hypothetical protein D031_0470A, partial [Vibrio parahaemolyticus VP-48]
MIFVPNI